METAAIPRVEDLSELQRLSQPELIERIELGLPAELARELAGKMDINQEQLATLLRLTPRTLQRRMEAGRLELIESERLWELARLLFRAVDVLEITAGAGPDRRGFA
jgi:putative toxin-antitoxin system antitoxin component (TIGR02293 family)